LLFRIRSFFFDEGDHIVFDAVRHLHRLLGLRPDQPLEDNEHFLERILPDHQLTDVVREFLHCAAVEYLGVAYFF
jgi:hypothetical protein